MASVVPLLRRRLLQQDALQPHDGRVGVVQATVLAVPGLAGIKAATRCRVACSVGLGIRSGHAMQYHWSLHGSRILDARKKRVLTSQPQLPI